ncbi:MAG TPA: phosphoribosylanthranilate isomerase [Longimicrobiales bacterium]
MTRVKICGLCRPEDAGVAEAAGADYIGVILAPGGPRSQPIEAAAAIYAAAPGLKRVGVFVDASPETMASAARRLGLDVLQLHGAEDPRTVAALAADVGREVWKAVRPRDRAEFLAAVDRYGPVADALLLDGWSERGAGGTGTRFPWDEVAAVRDRVPAGLRLVAAGGLHPGNVTEAVARLSPDIVDVSSGVERRVGEKAPERVRAFVAAVRGVA